MRNKARAMLRNLRVLPQAAVVVSAIGSLGLLFWIALSIDKRPKEAELIAVLAITITAVIVAAFFTAIIHKAISPSDEATPPGVVFRESIKRYAWLAAPIASGYGIAQVISRVAEIVSGGS